MSQYLHRSAQLELLGMLRDGPQFASEIAELAREWNHRGQPRDMVADLNRFLEGGQRIISRWVGRPTKWGRVRELCYELVRE